MPILGCNTAAIYSTCNSSRDQNEHVSNSNDSDHKMTSPFKGANFDSIHFQFDLDRKKLDDISTSFVKAAS